MQEYYSVSALELNPNRLYDLLTFAIQPRPIAFVSTLGPKGVPNLAPFSFFMPGGANPPSLAFSVNRGGGGRRKDTLLNIESSREFVVNMVTRAMAEGMNACSFSYPSDVSEWDGAGFTPVPSVTVRPPRVGESPIQLECRLFQVVEHGQDSGAAAYVIGEIVQLHIDVTLWGLDGATGRPFLPISRLGGANYLDCELMESFELPRPT